MLAGQSQVSKRQQSASLMRLIIDVVIVSQRYLGPHHTTSGLTYCDSDNHINFRADHHHCERMNLVQDDSENHEEVWMEHKLIMDQHCLY